MPIGCSPKSAEIFAGTTDATGIASNFGKIASAGVERDADGAVVDSGDARDGRRLSRAKCASTGDRIERPRPAGFVRGIEHAREAVHDIARVEQRAVVEADAGSQMKQVGPAVGSYLPARGESWPDLRIGAEAGETVEEVGDRATGGNISRERGVERFGIVAVARVDQGAAVRGLAAMTGGEGEERNE